MAKQTINNGDAALVTRIKINDNFSELYSNKAITNHASSTTNYGLGSITEYGHLKVNNNNGLLVTDGTISINLASTNSPGTVQLIDSYSSTSTAMAPTANALKNALSTVMVAYSGSGEPNNNLGKNGDIYFKLS